jgi:hypothetical protein
MNAITLICDANLINVIINTLQLFAKSDLPTKNYIPWAELGQKWTAFYIDCL